MATRIRLKRMGRKFYAFYRVVIADSRKKRDGKVIEQIGIYDPNKQPSLIQIDSERAQYWLGVGAQPSEPVVKLLKITGDWQKFKGLPGAEAEARIKAADDKAQKLKAAKSEAKAKAEEEAKAAAEAAAKEAESSESEAEAETADSSAESAEESSSEEKAE